MTFHYDTEADALDIGLRAGIVARTVQLDAGTLVDLDAAGNVVSIEVIRPSRPWPLDELFARFPIAEDDAAVLRSFWGENKPYPFEAPELVLA